MISARNMKNHPLRWPQWQPWLQATMQACLLLLVMLLATPAHAQHATAIGIPVDPINDPVLLTTPALVVTRTPAVLVAGQPFTITWNASQASVVEVSCNQPAGGLYPVNLPSGITGSVSGLASSLWVGKTFDCIWLADNGTGQKTFVDHVSTSGQGQPASPLNNAALVSQNVSASMTSGQSYRVQLTMQNTGNTTWVAGEYKLGSQNPQDNLIWGMKRVELGSNVAPGASTTFDFNVTAPTNTGAPAAYGMQWRMVQEYKESFGATASSPVTVSAVAPVLKNDAAFVSQSVPTAMTTGQSANVSVTMKNTGTTTWGVGTYFLGAQNPMDNRVWMTGNRVALSAPVAPNGTATFSFPVTAPLNPGTYNFQWQMVQEGTAWFGAMSTNASIAVTPPLPAITVTRSPNPMTASQPFNLSWKASNATALSRTCTSAVAGGFASSGAMTIDASGNGSAAATADPAWVNKPSVCTWTATGPGGTASISETMTTNAAPPPTAPVITVTRTPNPMQAAKAFTLNWRAANATTLSRTCTAAAGGYVSSGTMAIDANGNGSASGVADPAWINKPSTCTWTATGSGGTTSITETMTTTTAPTITVVRTPNPMLATQPFTLNWSVTDTKTLTRTCTSTTGGFVGNDVMAFDAATGKGGTQGTLADANWVNKPSTCTWTATGDGGTTTITETMTTLAKPTGPVVTYIHTDGLGSPVARTNEAGQIISRTRYEPYGATAGGATPTIGFTGHVNDADTGLTYMQQRYYDPVAGRFMSVDPVLTDANTGSSFNRYVYANNSPYNKVDPDGRQSECSWRNQCQRIDYTNGDGGASNSPLPPGSGSGPGLGAAGGFMVGATAGFDIGLAISGGCDILSIGTCAPLNPLIVGGSSLVGGLVGYITMATNSSSNSSSSGSTGSSTNGSTDDSTTRITNPKHHPNSTSPEPKNADALFKKSVVDKNGVRWAKDTDGTYHRFSKPSNGESHWNGSTKGVDPIKPQNIPVDVKRSLGAN